MIVFSRLIQEKGILKNKKIKNFNTILAIII